ncbi:hypothetical protein K6U06_14835 [Acidiferrimicrobium sp. IK]|uniref:hypothetical protein n=1 Tax=Acidiferrimicrobium sp. IK TaxID=2871700 RepID=UPI0021CB4C30|nr:hypothetical protein [Acidiferrimicrobium sp. IK]MCU4185641.1 hypothetical protein [Acidiferrimicrobium sp. IK]
MSGLVFDNPAGGQPATAAEYLSGNVRQRLDQAGRAVEQDPRWQGSPGRASRSFGRPARS